MDIENKNYLKIFNKFKDCKTEEELVDTIVANNEPDIIKGLILSVIDPNPLYNIKDGFINPMFGELDSLIGYRVIIEKENSSVVFKTVYLIDYLNMPGLEGE